MFRVTVSEDFIFSKTKTRLITNIIFTLNNIQNNINFMSYFRNWKERETFRALKILEKCLSIINTKLPLVDKDTAIDQTFY